MGQGTGSVPLRVVVTRTSHHHTSTTTPSAPGGGHLPFTGAPIDGLTAAACALLAVGATLVTAIRRKPRSAVVRRNGVQR